MKRRRLELDVLRVIACLVVYIYHTVIVASQVVDFSSEGIKSFWINTPAWGGVWIFFFLSALFAGRAFLCSDYEYSLLNILKFYISKFLKIGIPTYFFAFLLIVSYHTSYVEKTDDIIRILTFRFNGTGSVAGIGALWYISSLMQLFFLTPLLCFIISKIYKKNKSNLFWGFIVGIIIAVGLLYRIVLSVNNIDWYEWIYTFSLANLDIYICGLICNLFCYEKFKESTRVIKYLVSLELLVLIVSNVFIYYLANNGNTVCLKIYQNIYPSLYIIVLLSFVVGYHNSNADINLIKKETYKSKYSIVMEKLSCYTFWFYLWHSFVLNQMCVQIRISSVMMTYIRLLLCGAVISLGLSIIFEKGCSMILMPFMQKVQNFQGHIGKLLLQFLAIPIFLIGMFLGFSYINSWGVFARSDYPQFLGEGTLEAPYLIQDKNDLEVFRDMVNEGIEFKDTYFLQTDDIDLQNEEWIPIGIYNTENYFKGTYNGGGHCIKNLLISNAYSAPTNVGFFGILEGSVKNLGIESGYVEGDCVGGIASHGGEQALILNCYNKAFLKGTTRAGGICDNLGNGSVINCVNNGKIEAPNSAQLVSYSAKRLIGAHLDKDAFTDCFGGVYINLPVFEESLNACLNQGIDILVDAQIIDADEVVKW